MLSFLGETALYYLFLMIVLTVIGFIGCIIFSIIHQYAVDTFTLFYYSTIALLFSDISMHLIVKYETPVFLGRLIVFLFFFTMLSTALKSAKFWSLLVLVNSIILFFTPSVGLLSKLPWLITIVEWIENIPILFIVFIIISIPLFLSCLFTAISYGISFVSLTAEAISNRMRN